MWTAFSKVIAIRMILAKWRRIKRHRMNIPRGDQAPNARVGCQRDVSSEPREMERLMKSFWLKLTGMDTNGSSGGTRRRRGAVQYAVASSQDKPQYQKLTTTSLSCDDHFIMLYLCLDLAISNIYFEFVPWMDLYSYAVVKKSFNMFEYSKIISHIFNYMSLCLLTLFWTWKYLTI